MLAEIAEIVNKVIFVNAGKANTKDVKKKKTCQLGIRLDEDFADKLKVFEATTGIPQAVLARASLEAALNFYLQNGKIEFPLRCVSADFGE